MYNSSFVPNIFRSHNLLHEEERGIHMTLQKEVTERRLLEDSSVLYRNKEFNSGLWVVFCEVQSGPVRNQAKVTVRVYHS